MTERDPAARVATGPLHGDVAISVKIDRQIDDSVVRRFNETMALLIEREVQFVIIELATPGGTIAASRKLAEAIDNLSDQGIETNGRVSLKVLKGVLELEIRSVHYSL